MKTEQNDEINKQTQFYVAFYFLIILFWFEMNTDEMSSVFWFGSVLLKRICCQGDKNKFFLSFLNRSSIY